MTNRNQYEDIQVNIKIILSSLWASVTLCYLYGDYFGLYVPGKVEGMVSGENMLDSPARLLMAAAFLAIPGLMVFLSVLLKPSINRWLNIIVGLFFTIIVLLIAFNFINPWGAFYLFLAIIEAVLTSLIVWYAFKWPKQNQDI